MIPTEIVIPLTVLIGVLGYFLGHMAGYSKGVNWCTKRLDETMRDER